MPFGWFKSSADAEEKKSFFVITAIFNPASYQSRYDLYRQFAKHMEDTKAQLITIECIFPSLNQNTFQVTDSKNPNHIQLKSKSVYWMKENLINIAVQRLPPHAKWVCWLDGDIHFSKKNWVSLTIKQLKKYLVVQVFKKAEFLGPPPNNNVLRKDYSFGYSVVNGKPIDQTRYDEWYPHSGYGWAMDVEAYRKVDGLPDYDIVGSGDLHFAFSLINKVSNAIEDNLHPEFKKMILNKSSATANTLESMAEVQKKKLVGHVPMTIQHYWHGSRKDRQYVERWKILIAHRFNFNTDVTRNSDGLLEFVEKVGSSTNIRRTIQEDILEHFLSRKEDAKSYIPGDNDVVFGNKVKSVTKKPETKPKIVVPKIAKLPKRKKSDGSFDFPDLPSGSDDHGSIPEIPGCSDDGGNDPGHDDVCTILPHYETIECTTQY